MDGVKASINLRELRLHYDDGKPISQEKLSKLLTERYGVSISKQTIDDYERPARHGTTENITRGEAIFGMRTEYLDMFADFYGVSTDYILGRSEQKTPDVNAQAAIAYTGLSEDAIAVLHEFLTSPYRFSCQRWCDYLLTSHNFTSIAAGLSDYASAVAKSAVDEWKRQKAYKEAAKQGKTITLPDTSPSFDDVRCGAGWRLSDLVHKMTEDVENTVSNNYADFLLDWYSLIKDEKEANEFLEYRNAKKAEEEKRNGKH